MMGGPQATRATVPIAAAVEKGLLRAGGAEQGQGKKSGENKGREQTRRMEVGAGEASM